MLVNPMSQSNRKTGSLGGYRWGLNIKNNILKTEFLKIYYLCRNFSKKLVKIV